MQSPERESCYVPQPHFLEPLFFDKDILWSWQLCCGLKDKWPVFRREMWFTTGVLHNPNADGKCIWLQEFTIQCNVNFHSNRTIFPSHVYIFCKWFANQEGTYFRSREHVMKLKHIPLFLFTDGKTEALRVSTMFEHIWSISIQIEFPL